MHGGIILVLWARCSRPSELGRCTGPGVLAPVNWTRCTGPGVVGPMYWARCTVHIPPYVYLCINK